MNYSLKESLQENFTKNYNIFLNIKINGIHFEIMPVQKDIPIIENVTYNENSDELIILFKSTSPIKETILLNEYISYTLTTRDEISGFTVNNVNKLVENGASDKLKTTFKIKATKSRNLDVKEAIKENMKRRNLESIKDFLLDTPKELMVS